MTLDLLYCYSALSALRALLQFLVAFSIITPLTPAPATYIRTTNAHAHPLTQPTPFSSSSQTHTADCTDTSQFGFSGDIIGGVVSSVSLPTSGVWFSCYSSDGVTYTLQLDAGADLYVTGMVLARIPSFVVLGRVLMCCAGYRAA